MIWHLALQVGLAVDIGVQTRNPSFGIHQPLRCIISLNYRYNILMIYTCFCRLYAVPICRKQGSHKYMHLVCLCLCACVCACVCVCVCVVSPPGSDGHTGDVLPPQWSGPVPQWSRPHLHPAGVPRDSAPTSRGGDPQEPKPVAAPKWLCVTL